MNDRAIDEGLTEIFRDLFGDDAIVLTPRMTADDVDGWDSIKHISLIVAIEDRFGIKFTTAEIERLRDVVDFVEAIRAKAGR